MGEGTTALLSAVVAAGGGLLVPPVIARLPEPEPDPLPEPVPDPLPEPEPAEAPADVPAKPAYADLAATPGLPLACAAAAALAGAAVGWRLGWSAALPAWLFLCVAGVLLAFVDWRPRLLPTAGVAPTDAVVAGLLLAAAVATGDWESARRALLGWLVAGGLFLLLWFVHPRGMGYGDVRLAGVLGLALGWLGWAELVTGVYAAFCLGAIGGGVLALARVVDRRQYPFGPFLLLGALVGLVWGAPLAGWYRGG